MEEQKRDGRKEVVMADLEALVPKDHLLRKIERVMNYECLYERLDLYNCHDNGRPGTDPVVLIKMVLIQHLYLLIAPTLKPMQTRKSSRRNRCPKWQRYMRGNCGEKSMRNEKN